MFVHNEHLNVKDFFSLCRWYTCTENYRKFAFNICICLVLCSWLVEWAEFIDLKNTLNGQI